MSFKVEDLIKKAEQITKNKSLNELEEQFTAKLVNIEQKNDKRGRECLYLTFSTEKNETIIIKYTNFHLKDLALSFKKLGITDLKDAIGKTLVMKQKTYTIGYPRHYPISIVV